jgi:drug/metabolite transporter (DMT)-like permease
VRSIVDGVPKVDGVTVSGAWWAVSAGLGFGLFQAVNRRAVRGMGVLLATFIQLLVSALVLGAITFATQDLNELRNAPTWAIIDFALAGLLHFFTGWTFLNASQKRIGAARTSPLISTTPLFGAVFAAISLREFPGVMTIVAILIIIFGVYLVNDIRAERERRGDDPDSPPRAFGLWGSIGFGLAASICWSISPIFIRAGLTGLPSPLIGVTVGVSFSALSYAVLLVIRRERNDLGMDSMDAFLFKILAGVLVGFSTWMRWIALDLAPVAVVLALVLVSVPVVNLLSPLLVGRNVEQVTRKVWMGSSLVVAGSLVLILLT